MAVIKSDNSTDQMRVGTNKAARVELFDSTGAAVIGTGGLPVNLSNQVSTMNSTTTPLGAGASFTGAWESLIAYPEFDTNLAGTAGSVAPGTLFLEFSPDGTNVDVSIPLSVADINTGIVPVPLRSVLPFFRVRYVNGGVVQTSLRITVLLHRTNATRLTRFPGQTATINEPSEAVLAILSAKNPALTYTEIRSDANDVLMTTPGGNVASGAADSGNPLKIGGVFHSAAPSFTDGQRADIQVDSTGRLLTDTGGNIGSGSTDSGNPVKVGAVFNSTPPTVTTGQRVDLQADANGRLQTNAVLIDSPKATYAASVTALATAASATDIFIIVGSASKTIRVTNIIVSATGTSAGDIELQIIKRSGDDTGGTSVVRTNIPYDTTFPAATATVRSYTANPTVGTPVGTIAVRKLLVSTSATQGSIFDTLYGNRPAAAVVLRGVGQSLAVNLNGTTVAGSSFDISIEWTEE